MNADEVAPLNSARRSPFQLFVLIMGVVVGWPLLFGGPTPGSTTELLGPFWARVWGWILVCGCFVALVGVWWTWWGWLGRWLPRWRPSPSTGLLIEQGGLVAAGAGTLIYVVAVVAAGNATPSRAWIATGLVLGMGLACFWRVGQIQRHIRATIRQLQEANAAAYREDPS